LWRRALDAGSRETDHAPTIPDYLCVRPRVLRDVTDSSLAAPLPGATSGIDVTFDNVLVQSVPEPGSLALTGLDMAAASLWVTWYCRRARQK
jgi:hypothetical protein